MGQFFWALRKQKRKKDGEGGRSRGKGKEGREGELSGLKKGLEKREMTAIDGHVTHCSVFSFLRSRGERKLT